MTDVSSGVLSEKKLVELVVCEIRNFRPQSFNVGVGVNSRRDTHGFVRNYHIYLKLREDRNLKGMLRTGEYKDVNLVFRTLRSELPQEYQALDPTQGDFEEGPMEYLPFILSRGIKT